MRFVKTLALAGALSLGAPMAGDLGAKATQGLSPALSQALDSFGTANAAFIRRGKLKKRPSVGYKVVVVTDWDESNPEDDNISTIDVAFPSVEGGSLPGETIDQPRGARKRFKGTNPDATSTTALVLIAHDGEGNMADFLLDVPEFDPTVPGSAATAVTEEGYKVDLLVLENGTLRAAVFNEDRHWSPATVGGVRFGEVELPYIRTTQRWVTNLDSSGLPEDFGDGSSYTIATTAKDEAGNVVDSQTSSESVGGVVSGADIAKVRLKETDSGKLRVTTTTDGFDPGGNSLAVTVTAGNGDTVMATLDDMSATTDRLWFMQTLTFDDPASATDQPYGVVVSAYDSLGNLLGAADAEIVVEGLDGGEIAPPPGTPFTLGTTDAEIGGRIAIKASDATNFTLSVALNSAAVERVDVEITDLVGNAAAPESTSFSAPDYQVRKWRSLEPIAAPVGTDSNPFYTVTVEMIRPDGETTSTATATVFESAATAYKRNGGCYHLCSANELQAGAIIAIDP